MSEVIQVVTTTPTRDEAERMARELVSRRLAACVQIGGPILSTFHWQGVLETSQEWTCIIKSLRDRLPAIEAAILELHSYEIPEILTTEITAVSPSYLNWLKAELSTLDS